MPMGSRRNTVNFRSLKITGDDFVKMKDIGKLCNQRLRNKFDILNAITGYEGIGKSSCAYDFLINSYGKKLDFKRHTFFEVGFNDILNHYRSLEAFEPAWFDEIIKQADKRRHQTKDNIQLSALFTMCRSEYKNNVFCIPRLRMLDLFFRDGRSYLWMFIFRRGLGVLYKADETNPYGDPWNLRANMKSFTEVRNLMGGAKSGLGGTMRALKTSLNFYGFFKYKRMPPDVEADYESWKNEHKYQGIEGQFQTESVRMTTYRRKVALYHYFLYKMLGFQQNHLALIEGIKATNFATENEFTEFVQDKDDDTPVKRMESVLNRYNVRINKKKEKKGIKSTKHPNMHYNKGYNEERESVGVNNIDVPENELDNELGDVLE